MFITDPAKTFQYGKWNENTVMSSGYVLPSVDRIMYFQFGDCHGGSKYSVSHVVIIHPRYSLRSETG